MKILIAGIGQVGRYLGNILSQNGHDVTLIDNSEQTILQLEDEIDARLIFGNGSSASVLIQAEVSRCDYFLAMTSDDMTNLVASSIAKALGARHTLCRIHDETYSDHTIINHQLHFGIDSLVNPELLSAVELAKRLRHPHRVAVESFAKGQIEVQQFRVGTGSNIINQPLHKLRLGKNVRVGLIQRDQKSQIAQADSELQTGDLVTLFGKPDDLYEARSLFDPKADQENVRVVLFGGGEIAIGLIRLLNNPRFKIRVIERDHPTCRLLASKFPHITVIHGEGTSLRLLEEEQIGNADYFIACTKNDEYNIMACLQAGKLGSRHLQMVVNKPDYEDILERMQGALGIEHLVTPHIAAGEEVLRYLQSGDCTELMQLPNDVGSVVEVHISLENPLVGKTLREISLPSGCIIVALQHLFQARVPGAEDKILAEDRVLALVSKPQMQAFKEKFNI
jgi:trk system potassium uptake protein TrkA